MDSRLQEVLETFGEDGSQVLTFKDGPLDGETVKADVPDNGLVKTFAFIYNNERVEYGLSGDTLSYIGAFPISA